MSFTGGAPDLLAHGQLLMGIFIPKKYKQLIRELTNQEPHILFFFCCEEGGMCSHNASIGLVIHTITYVSSYLYNTNKRPQQDGHEAFFCGSRKKNACVSQ